MRTIIFERVDSFLISVLFLIAVVIYILKYVKNTKLKIDWLLTAAVLVIFQSILEGLCITLEAFKDAKYTTMIYFLNSFALILCTAITMIETIFYCDYVLEKNKTGQILRKITAIPIIVDIMLMISNFYTGLLFSVDSSQNLVKGEYYYLHFSIIHVIGLFVFITTFEYYRKNKDKEKLVIFILLSIIVVASTFEILGSANTLVNPFNCFSIAMILLYIKMNNQTINSLTRLVNLERFYELIEERKKVGARKYTIALLDIDGLNEINTKYNYTEGNTVLKEFSKAALRKVKSPNLVASSGSDEIIIYYENLEKEKVEEEILKLYNEINVVNMNSTKSYSISFSYVLEEYNKDKHKNVNDIVQYLYYKINKEKTL